jgi:hypothetical protein
VREEVLGQVAPVLKLVFVRVATILPAAVGQYAQKLDVVLLEQRRHPIIEQICRRDRCLAVIELGGGHLGAGVDEGLPIAAADKVLSIPWQKPPSKRARKILLTPRQLEA